MQVSTLGIMPPVMVPSAISAGISPIRNSLDELLVLVEHAGHVGEQQQPLGAQRPGDGAGERVGVDVVGFAFRAQATGASTGISSRPQHLLQHGGVDLVRLADEAEIDGRLAVLLAPLRPSGR